MCLRYGDNNPSNGCQHDMPYLCLPGISLGMCPANERCCYIVTCLSFAGRISRQIPGLPWPFSSIFKHVWYRSVSARKTYSSVLAVLITALILFPSVFYWLSMVFGNIFCQIASFKMDDGCHKITIMKSGGTLRFRYSIICHNKIKYMFT